MIDNEVARKGLMDMCMLVVWVMSMEGFDDCMTVEQMVQS